MSLGCRGGSPYWQDADTTQRAYQWNLATTDRTMASTAEQVWQTVTTDGGDSAIGCQLLQLDLAAFPVENNSRATGWISG